MLRELPRALTRLNSSSNLCWNPPDATASIKATDATAPTANANISQTPGVPLTAARIPKEAVIATEYPYAEALLCA